jgi:CRISPR system Cascade subunit CasD
MISVIGYAGLSSEQKHKQMPLFLLLRLEAPLAAFGDIMVDAKGPISDLPSASMLTGLFANALGYRREDKPALQRLQDRLVHAARLDRSAGGFTEFQTAKLEKSDIAWTTRGRPEGRAGGDASYLSPHLRYRDFAADIAATIAIHLLPEDEEPDVVAIASALQEPFRPLFIGRKPCLPSRPIYYGFLSAPTFFDALLATPLAPARKEQPYVHIELPWSEPKPEDFHAVHKADRRDWVAGVHTGDTIRWAGSRPRDAFTPEAKP